MRALEERTQREDMYKALKSIVKSNNIEMKLIISLTIDAAPAMLRRGKGLVGRILKDNSDLITYHYMIQQTVLFASLGDEYREVMETIIKLVNFLRSTSALQHRFLQNFLYEINANYTDLLVHNNVRYWPSKGRVLERFWLIRKEIMVFLEDQSNVKSKAFLTFLKDDKQMEIVGLLTDIILHLNDLNVKLQGKQHICTTLFKIILTLYDPLALVNDIY